MARRPSRPYVFVDGIQGKHCPGCEDFVRATPGRITENKWLCTACRTKRAKREKQIAKPGKRPNWLISEDQMNVQNLIKAMPRLVR